MYKERVSWLGKKSGGGINVTLTIDGYLSVLSMEEVVNVRNVGTTR